MKFCCRNFLVEKKGNILSFFLDSRCKDTIVVYYPRAREYIIFYSKKSGCYIQYCPWCGRELPKELADQWYDILEKEYGLIDVNPGDYHDKRIPKEFWTDEWWKKRGL